MNYFTHSFEAPIEEHALGRYAYTVVYLPPELHDELPLKEHPRLRIDAEIAEVPIDGALQPVRGRWYLMVPRPLMKQCGFSLGDRIEVRFRVGDQDAVDVPAELEQALHAKGNRKALAAWKKLTPGAQRGFAHHIKSAKTEPTRNKRLVIIIEAIAAGKKNLRGY